MTHYLYNLLWILHVFQKKLKTNILGIWNIKHQWVFWSEINRFDNFKEKNLLVNIIKNNSWSYIKPFVHLLSWMQLFILGLSQHKSVFKNLRNLRCFPFGKHTDLTEVCHCVYPSSPPTPWVTSSLLFLLQNKRERRKKGLLLDIVRVLRGVVSR